MNHQAAEISQLKNSTSELPEAPDSSTTAREIPAEARAAYAAALVRARARISEVSILRLLSPTNAAEGYAALDSEDRAIAEQLGRVSAKTFPAG